MELYLIRIESIDVQEDLRDILREKLSRTTLVELKLFDCNESLIDIFEGNITKLNLRNMKLSNDKKIRNIEDAELVFVDIIQGPLNFLCPNNIFLGNNVIVNQKHVSHNLEIQNTECQIITNFGNFRLNKLSTYKQNQEELEIENAFSFHENIYNTNIYNTCVKNQKIINSFFDENAVTFEGFFKSYHVKHCSLVANLYLNKCMRMTVCNEKMFKEFQFDTISTQELKDTPSIEDETLSFPENKNGLTDLFMKYCNMKIQIDDCIFIEPLDNSETYSQFLKLYQGKNKGRLILENSKLKITDNAILEREFKIFHLLSVLLINEIIFPYGNGFIDSILIEATTGKMKF